jgi:hypothetical protein
VPCVRPRRRGPQLVVVDNGAGGLRLAAEPPIGSPSGPTSLSPGVADAAAGPSRAYRVCGVCDGGGMGFFPVACCTVLLLLLVCAFFGSSLCVLHHTPWCLCVLSQLFLFPWVFHLQGCVRPPPPPPIKYTLIGVCVCCRSCFSFHGFSICRAVYDLPPPPP